MVREKEGGRTEGRKGGREELKEGWREGEKKGRGGREKKGRLEDKTVEAGKGQGAPRSVWGEGGVCDWE